MSAKKPKVLIVHNYYQIPGGEDVVVKNEKHLLEKHGHKVITYERHNSELKNMPKVRKISLLFSSIFKQCLLYIVLNSKKIAQKHPYFLKCKW